MAAGILLCIVPGGNFWREASRLRAELDEARTHPAPSLVPAPPIVTLALNVPSTCGAVVPVLRVHPNAGLVQVILDIEPGYEFYEVRVESADRGLVFSQGLQGFESHHCLEHTRARPSWW